MRNSSIFRSLALVMLGFGMHQAYAIDPNRAMSQYIRDHWGKEQNFPQGPVYAITQTADGYLWVGTEAGLVRFDGTNFRLIPTPKPSALGLEPGDGNSLYVRLKVPSMMRFHDGVFENLHGQISRDAFITAMCRGRKGGLVLASMQQGTLAYNNEKFTLISDASALPRSPIISIAQTGDGVIWMGTRDSGLFRVDGAHTTAVTKGLPDPKVNCLLADGNSSLWVGTDSGIVKWDGRELTTAGIPASLRGHQALAMVKDRDGNVWVGTDAEGLLRFNSHGVASFEQHVFGGAVTALFEDRESNLWVGRADGIERIRDSTFVSYSVAEGLASDSSGPIYAAENGQVWIAPISGGLTWLNKGKSGRITLDGLNSDVVYSIAGGPNELWLGRQRGGLTRLRIENGRFSAKSFRAADGLTQNSVYSVYRTHDGAVWAGTLSGGVSRLEGGKFTTWTTADGLASNTVASILQTSDGVVWFATPNGLSAFSNGRWHSTSVGQGLPSANVNCLLEDSAGVLWAGTAAGLAAVVSGQVQVPSNRPKLLNEQILGMAEDRNGSLWVATSNHVVRVNRDKLLRGTLGDGDVREYGLPDGLLGTEGVKRHQSVVEDADGQIWFSMSRGLSVVDPARLIKTSAAAIVQIQGASANGRQIDLRGPIRIPSGRQRIILSFAGLSLSVPERVRFRYRLEGFDHDWSEPATTREAVYTNLSPAHYRFRVMASNPDGVWNATESAIDFEIQPALWQIWWLRVAAAALVALLIAGLYLFRVRQMTKQLSVRFEERLLERTRIAQDLHDTLLQGFLSASMQLHVAADALPAESPSKPPLKRVLELMTQVINEGRNTVRGLRSSQHDDSTLEQSFAAIPDELGAGENVAFRVIVEGRPKVLRPLMRDEVYKIGREALVNALRHSHAETVDVEVQYASRHLRVLVRDKGCGIDPRVLQAGREGHWGLAGMRERAERVGAQFHVWSQQGDGTEVELVVPGHIAFQNSSDRGIGFLPRLTWRKRADSRNGKNL